MINASEKVIFRVICAVSVLVFILVLILNKKVIPVPDVIPSWAYQLPRINAIINGTCFVLLLTSLYYVKKKRYDIHKRLNLITFSLSSLFLVCYVTYHWLVPETSFGGTGWVKYFYYFILISHIILAALVLPLVLLSFYYGLKDNRPKHKKMVRWSYPIWVYVTFTGVLVYLLLSPYYNFPG